MYIFVRLYTRITPIALDIYEDNTHIKPNIGHSINTGTHICPDSGFVHYLHARVSVFD